MAREGENRRGRKVWLLQRLGQSVVGKPITDYGNIIEEDKKLLDYSCWENQLGLSFCVDVIDGGSRIFIDQFIGGNMI